MRERFLRFMSGRNGSDRLTNFLVGLSLLLLILTSIFRIALLRILGLGVLFFAYFRIFSKDLPRRREENLVYISKVNKLKNKISSKLNLIKGLKDYKYFKCPSCNQKIRVPRGKGKIKITCPKCKEEIRRRS